ncbi:MAG TPA: hypothetical protein VK610_06050, partial [Rhodothermales bacterium]|nr:hypothetical protein [Rhodothermales bacterium]
VHEVGPAFSRWLAVDVLWGVAGGLAIGAGLGWAVGRLVLYLRQRHREALGMDDFLALGLIALAYGVALHAHAYGFLAVFAAGLALRQTAHAERVDTEGAGGATERADAEGADAASVEAEAERRGGKTITLTLADPEGSLEEAGTDPETAPQVLVAVTLGVTEQLERAAEVALVLVVGALLLTVPFVPQALWFVPLLLLVIRPVAVYLGLWAAPVSGTQRALAAWFGVRGVGSLYYLAYALTHGLPEGQAPLLMGLMLWTVAVSVVVHGVSVTPLMDWYQARRRG